MSLEQRKIIMNSFISSQFNYCPLLWMCHCRTIHTQINKSTTQIWIGKHLNLYSPLMSELFKIKETKYNLRYAKGIVSTKQHTTMYGLDSVSYLAPKIWEQIPTEIRNCKMLYLFTVKIKTWVLAKYPCRLCSVR